MTELYTALVTIVETKTVTARCQASSEEEARRKFASGDFEDRYTKNISSEVRRVEEFRTPEDTKEALKVIHARRAQERKWAEEVSSKLPFGRCRYSVGEDPNNIAVSGTCVVVSDISDVLYTSKTLTDPTWFDIAIAADEAIDATGDYHHVFLEGVYKERKHFTSIDAPVYNLCMGS